MTSGDGAFGRHSCLSPTASISAPATQGRRQRVIRHGDLASLAQAAAVADPVRHRRWGVWKTALHPAFVGARQRGRCAALCPSRADAQDGKDLAAEHRRRGDANALRARGQHSHDRRRRGRGGLPAAPQLRRVGAERALHDRATDQRSIRRRIDQAPVPVGHIKHRRSHSMAVVRHHAEPASPG